MPELPGLPRGDTLERAASVESQAPDPAWIAAIANSLFKIGPGEPPGGPGASLPSAPVYAVEPVIAQIPGAPVSAPPVSPNLTPGASGVPGPGASPPASPIHAYEPLTTAGTPTPNQAVPPSGEKGSSGPVIVPPLPLAGSPDIPAGGVPTGFLSEADLAAVPGTLGGAMSIIPPLNGVGPYGAPSAGLPSAPAAAPTPLPSPGASAPAAPVYSFEPLNYAGSPSRRRRRAGSRARAWRHQPGRVLLFSRRGLERVDPRLAASLRLERPVAQFRLASLRSTALSLRCRQSPARASSMRMSSAATSRS